MAAGDRSENTFVMCKDVSLVPTRSCVNRLTLIATIGRFLFHCDTAIISGTIAFVSYEFGMDAVLLRWFVSCALFGCVIGVADTGVLRDRFGSEPMLIMAAALFAVSGIGCMLAQDFVQLVVFRLLGGLAWIIHRELKSVVAIVV